MSETCPTCGCPVKIAASAETVPTTHHLEAMAAAYNEAASRHDMDCGSTKGEQTECCDCITGKVAEAIIQLKPDDGHSLAEALLEAKLLERRAARAELIARFFPSPPDPVEDVLDVFEARIATLEHQLEQKEGK